MEQYRSIEPPLALPELIYHSHDDDYDDMTPNGTSVIVIPQTRTFVATLAPTKDKIPHSACGKRS